MALGEARLIESESCPRCPGKLFWALKSFDEKGQLIRYQMMCSDCRYWECRHVDEEAEKSA